MAWLLAGGHLGCVASPMLVQVQRVWGCVWYVLDMFCLLFTPLHFIIVFVRHMVIIAFAVTQKQASQHFAAIAMLRHKAAVFSTCKTCFELLHLSCVVMHVLLDAAGAAGKSIARLSPAQGLKICFV